MTEQEPTMNTKIKDIDVTCDLIIRSLRKEGFTVKIRMLASNDDFKGTVEVRADIKDSHQFTKRVRWDGGNPERFHRETERYQKALALKTCLMVIVKSFLEVSMAIVSTENTADLMPVFEAELPSSRDHYEQMLKSLQEELG
jgi:hypothetical protein